MNFLRSDRIARLLAALCLIVVAFAVHGSVIARADDTQPVREAHGTDVGGDAMVVYVVRDKATWEDMKKEVGHVHVSPTGKASGAGLAVLDGVDFQKDMIVAVFWGRMNFAGHGENCRITGVKGDAKNGDREITVECVANLWGGDILRSYEAWPYAARSLPKTSYRFRSCKPSSIRRSRIALSET